MASDEAPEDRPDQATNAPGASTDSPPGETGPADFGQADDQVGPAAAEAPSSPEETASNGGEPVLEAVLAPPAENAADLAAELSDDEIMALLRGEGVEPQPAGELSDDQIAALLNGAGTEGNGASDRLAVEQILADSVVSQISAPMLTHISERLRGRLTISLRNHTSDNVELSDMTEILRYGEYINRVPLPVMIGVADAREWTAPMMVLVDGALIYGLIELLMGGRKNLVSRPDQRQFTAIEQKMVERTIQIVLDDLSAALSSVSEVNFTLRQIEINPRFAGLARDSDVVVLLRYKVQIEKRSGCIDLVLPRRTLEPVREQLTQRYLGSGGHPDAVWEERLRGQLTTTPVEVVSLLDTRPRMLRDVLQWRVGTLLPLEVTPETPVRMVYGGMDAWTGLMGRKDSHVAICLEQKVIGEIGNRPEG